MNWNAKTKRETCLSEKQNPSSGLTRMKTSGQGRRVGGGDDDDGGGGHHSASLEQQGYVCGDRKQRDESENERSWG